VVPEWIKHSTSSLTKGVCFLLMFAIHSNTTIARGRDKVLYVLDAVT
jgi:hypothetical protein